MLRLARKLEPGGRSDAPGAWRRRPRKRRRAWRRGPSAAGSRLALKRVIPASTSTRGGWSRAPTSSACATPATRSSSPSATTPRAPTSSSSSTSRPRTSARDDRRARPADGRQRLHPVHDRRRDPLGRRCPGGARRRRRQGLGQLRRARPARADLRACRGVRLAVRGGRDRRQRARRRASWGDVYVDGGATRVRGREAVAWAREAASAAPGEVLLTSMDRDGTTDGYDLELTRAVADAVAVPVIASGGAGSSRTWSRGSPMGGADAVLVASIFHYGEFTIGRRGGDERGRGREGGADEAQRPSPWPPFPFPLLPGPLVAVPLAGARAWSPRRAQPLVLEARIPEDPVR